jgi:hypothetical protein
MSSWAISLISPSPDANPVAMFTFVLRAIELKYLMLLMWKGGRVV